MTTIDLFRWPFAMNEHDFKEKECYIKKDAIRHRLTSIDPCWSETEPVIVSIEDDIVVMAARLTVCGATRSGTGTGIIQRQRKVYEDGADGQRVEKWIDVLGFNLAREKSKAYKTAASDCLARAAVEFGIGAYMKDPPRANGKSTITSPAALKAYLETLTAHHWSLNGQGEAFKAALEASGLKWPLVAVALEPGRKLDRVADTILTFEQASARLVAIAEERKHA